jgi:hypothetical protein
MKKSILIYSFLIVTLLFFSHCQTIGLSSPKNTIQTITYGTSFGHCVGLNCNKTYTISKEEIAFTKKGNGDTRDSLVRRAAIETEQWDNGWRSMKKEVSKELRLNTGEHPMN